MKNKNLVISVAGEVNSGKSRMCFLLKKFLRENGFDVEFDGGVDFENEAQFDMHTGRDFERVLDHIKETRTITLKEVQLQKGSDR
jgi:hypothetical protein